MKSMNRKEGKKIATIAAIIVGLMMFAFMPLASAEVTSFSVTPSTGLVGAVDSYNVLVTTTGVTSINITIPAGFIAVPPTTGGVEIARVEFWNTSRGDYYGYLTVTADIDHPADTVVISGTFRVGGDEFEYGPTPQNVNYTAGESASLKVKVNDGTAWANITLPTETEDGCINVNIDCLSLDLLQDVHIAIKQFVRNPLTASGYEFSADEKSACVAITGPSGRAIVFRDGVWFVDTNGNHIANQVFGYGLPKDIPLVWDIEGPNGIAIFRDGLWFVDTTGNHVADQVFGYGVAGDVPLVGDMNRDGTGDIAVFKDGLWSVNTTGNHVNPAADLVFGYGIPKDVPLVGDFNNDGLDDIAVFRDGVWYVDTTGDHLADRVFGYGLPVDDVPLVGDFMREGRDRIAVVRDGGWYVDTTGTYVASITFGYGIAGDVPLVGIN